MRNLSRSQIVLLAALFSAMVLGLAVSVPVAEARRNPTASTPRRWLPPVTTPTTVLTPTATAAATSTPIATSTATTAPSQTQPSPVATTAAAPTATATATATPADVSSTSPASTVGFTDDFESADPTATWADGSAHGNWFTRFTGYGTIRAITDGDRVLSLAPKASTSSGETHAALVVSNTTFTGVDFTVQMKTATQLRTPTPNAWETGWVIWNFTDETHFYYVTLKPNGLEIGKEDPAYPGAQRFLVTASSPTFAVGQWYTVRVKHTGNSFTVWVNGTQLATFTDNERPYSTGAVGLYTEDADVHFNNAVAKQP